MIYLGQNAKQYILDAGIYQRGRIQRSVRI